MAVKIYGGTPIPTVERWIVCRIFIGKPGGKGPLRWPSHV